ncbi:MAG TPA: type II toxin-antitoxin system RelE/ParE family toxin [Nitrososphaerales archaeon]|nr:type II toxin-antitoxin system RelE/ParE family toxin [Nitrososphaerales archaeon]
MVFKIEYKSSVSRDLKHLDKKAAQRVLRAISEELSKDPRAGEALRGEFLGLYKLRVGDYRVLYTVLKESVLILRIGHRNKVYG